MSKRVHFDQSFFAFDEEGQQVALYAAGRDYPASVETLHYVGAGAAHLIDSDAAAAPAGDSFSDTE